MQSPIYIDRPIALFHFNLITNKTKPYIYRTALENKGFDEEGRLSFHTYSFFDKNLPVYESLHLQICSGVPSVTILPPNSPPLGPKSMT